MTGILSGLLGGLGGNFNMNRGAAPRGYRSHLRIEDGDAAYDTAAEVLALIPTVGADWKKIWQFTCPPQQMIRFGYGSPSQPHNQGYLWFAVLDAGTDFQVGTLRLVIARARDREPQNVAEFDDTRLHTSTVTSLSTAIPNDINQMMALPEKVEYPFVGEDSHLQLWYKSTVAATTADAAQFSIPVTRYEL